MWSIVAFLSSCTLAFISGIGFTLYVSASARTNRKKKSMEKIRELQILYDCLNEGLTMDPPKLDSYSIILTCIGKTLALALGEEIEKSKQTE